MKTPWLCCLATLAAAEPGRVYCVVPSRWPPSRSLEAVASTWLKDCDSVTIAVSGSALINQISRRFSGSIMTSTPSTRRELDDVALSITARSSQHGRGTRLTG